MLPTREEFEAGRNEFVEMIIEMSPEMDEHEIADMRWLGERARNRRVGMSHGEPRFTPRFQGDTPPDWFEG